MAEIKFKSNEVRDYKEHYEFRLTVGSNIICQRYFKINNFNQESINSYELMSTIRNCAAIIDRDLKQKTHVYLEIFAPQVFKTVEEMNSYLEARNRTNSIKPGTGLVVMDSEKDYFMGDDGRAVECQFKFNDGELTCSHLEDMSTDYKFAFLIDGKEVCSTVWSGFYPKYVRNSIDLSNKRGKFQEDEIPFLSFEQYLLYRMVRGRNDLIWGLIRDICTVCSYPEDETEDYTTEDEYSGKLYVNRSKRFSYLKNNSEADGDEDGASDSGKKSYSGRSKHNSNSKNYNK